MLKSMSVILSRDPSYRIGPRQGGKLRGRRSALRERCSDRGDRIRSGKLGVLHLGCADC